MPGCGDRAEPPAAAPAESSEAEIPLTDDRPPETVALLPVRAVGSWRLGEAYAAGFTFWMELAAQDAVGLRFRPPERELTGAVPGDDEARASAAVKPMEAGRSGAPRAAPRPATRTGGKASPRAAPAQQEAQGPATAAPYTGAEVAAARLAADHVVAAHFTRDKGRLSLTVLRCPRDEPRGCDRFEETTPEQSPYAAVAGLFARALEAAGGRIPAACRSSWDKGVTRDPYAFLWLGRAALPFLAGEDAGEPLERAIRIDPKMAEAWYMWALTLWARGEAARKDPLDSLARADLLRGEFTAARRAMARIHLARAETERAEGLLAALASTRPDDLGLVQERAELAFSRGRPQDATRVLDEVPDGLARTVAVGRLRARVAQERESLDEAEAWLTRVAAAAPDDARARLQLGALARRRGALRDAEAWYRDAQRTGAGPDARVGLMQLMAEQGRFTEALVHAAALAAEEPAEPRWKRWEAWLLAAAGRAEDAAAAWGALARRLPRDPEPALGRCRALLELGDKGAVAACRDATRGAGDRAPAWLALGFALSRAGRRAEAIRAAELAVVKDPDLREAHALLAQLHPEGSQEARMSAARARIR